jgi:hypothetical protein
MYSKSSPRNRSFSVFAGALAFVIPLAIGCGPAKGKVTGSVTLDGQPLPAGTITFHPNKGISVAGEITDGQYTVAGVPAGDAKVTVDTSAIKGEADALGAGNRNMAKSMGRMPRGGQIPPEAKEALEKEKQRSDEMAQKATELKAKYRKIPDKYTKEDESGLTAQVKSGSNSFEFSLSSK